MSSSPRAGSKLVEFLDVNQGFFTFPICVAASAAWACFGLWPVWVITAAVLLTPTLLERLRASRSPGGPS